MPIVNSKVHVGAHIPKSSKTTQSRATQLKGKKEDKLMSANRGQAMSATKGTYHSTLELCSQRPKFLHNWKAIIRSSRNLTTTEVFSIV